MKAHYHPDHLLPEQKQALRKATRLEWITLGFLSSDVILLYLTMGQSQAMKTAWLDDALSMVPPAVFLIAERVRKREPTDIFPYGFHRVVSIAFLLASFALFTMGLFLVHDAVSKLATAEHPSIGSMKLFGHVVWAGWPMVAAAAWSGITAAILGRMKAPLGPKLHNKVLHADADMNKADWLVSISAISGVIGAGLGWWWADGAAALIISADILWDGLKNVKAGFADLIDRVPHTVDTDEVDPVCGRIESYVKQLPWIRESTVRLHEEGNLIFGQVFFVPSDDVKLPQKIERSLKALRAMDWRIRDVSMTPVTELPEHQRDVEP